MTFLRNTGTAPRRPFATLLPAGSAEPQHGIAAHS
jgi:hypothetical protein